MNPNHKPRKLDKILLLMDILALLVAFMFALWIRFGGDIAAWQMQLYSYILAAEMMFTVIIHFYRMPRKRNPAIVMLDPVDIFVESFHNQIILIALIALFLWGTQSAERVSRLAMLYMFLFNIVFVYLFRMLYWAYARRHRSHTATGRRVLVVTDEKHLEQVVHTLRMTLPKEEGIYGYALVRGLETEESKEQAAGQSCLNRNTGGNAAGYYGNNGETVTSEQEQPDITDRADLADLRFCGYIPGAVRNSHTDPIHEAFVYLPQYYFEDLKSMFDSFTKLGINMTYALHVGGDDLTSQLLCQRGMYQAIRYSSMSEQTDVLDVHYTVTNLDSAVSYVKSHLDQLAGEYMCFSNVHTTVMAYENTEYLKVLNGAALTFPDGDPIARKMRKNGYEEASRVPGPDFMGAMFRATMGDEIEKHSRNANRKVSHFFYGSTQKTLDLLRKNLEENYPGIDIRGMYSPPFRDLTPEEDAAVVDMINASGADIIWIGLGAPKQEKWMAAHAGMFHGVMAGVGAGFNFHAGNIRRAPYWVQKIGMEWLYRLFQDPKRLFSRYLVTNSKYLWYSITENYEKKG